MANISELATRPVGRLLWEYSLPGVVGMLVMALYNVVDRIFIGQVIGPEAIAGLAITFPLINITTAIGVLVGAGSASWVSIMLGRGENRQAHLVLGNAFVLTFINAAAYVAVFVIWMNPILHAFGAGDITLPYARTYMLWVLPGLPLTNLAFGFNNLMRASGYPVKAMVTMLIGAGVNIVLDALFVLVFDWGMVGAAVATDIAMAASAFFVMWHFGRPSATLRFKRGIYSLRASIIAKIVSVGAAPSLINIAACFINVLVNKSLLAHGGDMAIGAAGIFVTYTSLLVTTVLGISMGLQPIIGYNYGAGLLKRLRRALFLAVSASTVICAAGSLGGLVFARYIARAFTTDTFLLSITENCLHHAVWAFSVVGFQIIATTFFQSLGMSVKAIFLSLTRQVIFLIPLLLILPDRWGVDGVWESFPISDILSTLVCGVLVVFQLRRINRHA